MVFGEGSQGSRATTGHKFSLLLLPVDVAADLFVWRILLSINVLKKFKFRTVLIN